MAKLNLIYYFRDVEGGEEAAEEEEEDPTNRPILPYSALFCLSETNG